MSERQLVGRGGDRDEHVGVLGHLAIKMPERSEWIATESIAYLLDRSGAARKALHDCVRPVGTKISTALTYESQAWTANHGTPDIVGQYDAGREKVIIEGKFWAGLTAHQPKKYLKRLRRSRSGVLLFIAPEARRNSLWDELLQKVSSLKPKLIRTSVNIFAARLRTGPVLALTSWSQLLTHLDKHLRRDGDRARIGDVRQIMTLCNYQEDEQRVLSIPAADTYELISKTAIHACPAKGVYTTYQSTPYVTFRASGGVMNEIYEIDMVTRFKPWVRNIPRWIKPDIRERLADYIHDRRVDFGFGHGGLYSFYVLSRRVKFRLHHAPRNHSRGHCYFSLADLRNEKLSLPRLASSKETLELRGI